MNSPNLVKFWHFSDIEFRSAKYTDQVFAPHIYNGFEIGIIQSGILAFKYQGQEQIAPKGHLILINPGEVHDGYPKDNQGWFYRMIYLDISFLQATTTAFIRGSNKLPFFEKPVIKNNNLFNTFLLMHSSAEKKK